MNKQLDHQRMIIATVAIAGLLLALMQTFTMGWEEAKKSFFVGVSFKTGLVFLTLAIAWPNLKSLFRNTPRSVSVSLMIALVLVVIRPKAAIWILLALLASALINFVLKVIVRKMQAK